MAEKETNAKQGAKPAKGKGAKIAVAGVLAAVLALGGGYLGVCAVAGGDRVMPGVRLGGVDLGGMTETQAQAAMEQASQDRYETLEIPLQVGGQTVVFSAKDAQAHVSGGVDEALTAGKDSFLTRGWHYLAGVLGHKTDLGFEVSVDNAGYVDQVLDQVTEAVGQPVEQPHWEIQEDDDSAQLVLYKGKTGQTVDEDALREALMDALGQGSAEPIQVQTVTTPPEALDVAALAQEVDRESVNATIDPATEQVIPHKLGLTVDTAAAQKLLDDMEEGESGTLDLAVETPEVTTLALRATLFQDLLAEASSKISGTANRINNVKLATAACDGKVLLPGEQFSYNKATGQRTTAKGYREATGFVATGTEDMVGGGVCQPSSTLYLACLRADLEITQRYNHRYTVTYMPEGMDATVSWPDKDFIFTNNTPYPIKIQMRVENGQCVARLYGTKTTDTYIEMESVRLGSTPFSVVYKADPSVPRGHTQVLTTPYTGRTVEVYRNLYAKDGTLISRTLATKNVYQKCDKVIGYNPLDGAPDGSKPPVTPSDAPSEEVTDTPAAEATPAPETTPDQPPAPETTPDQPPAPEGGQTQPETPAPEAPAPEAPAPEVPAPEAPAPEAPQPVQPEPTIPVPQEPTVPEGAAPEGIAAE